MEKEMARGRARRGSSDAAKKMKEAKAAVKQHKKEAVKAFFRLSRAAVAHFGEAGSSELLLKRGYSRNRKLLLT